MISINIERVCSLGINFCNRNWVEYNSCLPRQQTSTNSQKIYSYSSLFTIGFHSLSINPILNKSLSLSAWESLLFLISSNSSTSLRRSEIFWSWRVNIFFICLYSLTFASTAIFLSLLCLEFLTSSWNLPFAPVYLLCILYSYEIRCLTF